MIVRRATQAGRLSSRSELGWGAQSRAVLTAAANWQMSSSTKATYLEYNLSLAQKLAKARVRPDESESGVASLLSDEAMTHDVFRTDVLPLLLSVASVALVTG